MYNDTSIRPAWPPEKLLVLTVHTSPSTHFLCLDFFISVYQSNPHIQASHAANRLRKHRSNAMGQRAQSRPHDTALWYILTSQLCLPVFSIQCSILPPPIPCTVLDPDLKLTIDPPDSEHSPFPPETPLHVDAKDGSNTLTKGQLSLLARRIAHGLRTNHSIGANGEYSATFANIKQDQLGQHQPTIAP